MLRSRFKNTHITRGLLLFVEINRKFSICFQIIIITVCLQANFNSNYHVRRIPRLKRTRFRQHARK